MWFWLCFAHPPCTHFRTLIFVNLEQIYWSWVFFFLKMSSYCTWIRKSAAQADLWLKINIYEQGKYSDLLKLVKWNLSVVCILAIISKVVGDFCVLEAVSVTLHKNSWWVHYKRRILMFFFLLFFPWCLKLADHLRPCCWKVGQVCPWEDVCVSRVLNQTKSDVKEMASLYVCVCVCVCVRARTRVRACMNACGGILVSKAALFPQYLKNVGESTCLRWPYVWLHNTGVLIVLCAADRHDNSHVSHHCHSHCTQHLIMSLNHSILWPDMLRDTNMIRHLTSTAGQRHASGQCANYQIYSLVQWNWFSDVTDACNSGASSDVREPISLHQAVW